MKNLETIVTTIELGGEENSKSIPVTDFKNRIDGKFGDKVLYSESSTERYLRSGFTDMGSNQLLHCLNIAYSYHFPIQLSPDLLWLAIIQGIAEYVRLYPEPNRGKLVFHEGKKVLEVRNDALLSDPSAWQMVPSQLVAKLLTDLGNKSDIAEDLQTGFSNTPEANANTFKIGVLDVYSSYYEYVVTSLCNIPKIYLEGSVEDWVLFQNKLLKLSEKLGLEWWLKHINPIINQIINAVKGHPDLVFWQSIYKLENRSGGPFIDGWIINFFPFLKTWAHADRDLKTLFPNGAVAKEELFPGRKIKKVYLKNPYLGKNQGIKGLTSDSFHSGLSNVPFIWNRAGEKIEMEIIGGFIGVSMQEEYNSIQPGLGWLVRKKK